MDTNLCTETAVPLMLFGLATLAMLDSLQTKYDFLQKSKAVTCLAWSATILVIGPVTVSTDCSVRLITTFLVGNTLSERRQLQNPSPS